MCNCIVFTNNFALPELRMFSQSMSQLCPLMRHTIIQNRIHVEITYVFDTCKIECFITNTQCFFMNNNYMLLNPCMSLYMIMVTFLHDHE